MTVARCCLLANVTRIWMHLAIGQLVKPRGKLRFETGKQ